VVKEPLPPSLEELLAVMGEAVIGEAAQGRHGQRLMDLTRPGQPEPMRSIAEAMALMMVKVEAREFELAQMVEQLKQVNAQLKAAALGTVEAMASALEARDPYTQGHAQRVGAYAEALARRLGLAEAEVEWVRLGGLLHDIGKIGFSDRLFSDEDLSLSHDLWEEIKQHPARGMGILKELDFLAPALDCVLCHHERIDGQGYPQGLKGDEIPLGARIVAVADVYDAITTDRPYQKGRSRAEALAILRAQAGTALCPECVVAFAAWLEGGELDGQR
jgi:putative nucleotidyltransferase with HDIG domain